MPPDDRPDEELTPDAEELLEDLDFRMGLRQESLRLLEMMTRTRWPSGNPRRESHPV